jgi:thiol-disulfide isomerase/thioredoxin/Tfp pilus assembly protein PilF
MKTKLTMAVALLAALWLNPSASAGSTPATPASQAILDRAASLAKEQRMAEAAESFFAAIEADRDNYAAHEALIKFMHSLRREAGQPGHEVVPAIEARYAEWEKKYPQSAGVNFGLGVRYHDEEDPRAKPYLLKVVALDPACAQGWSMLSGDAERWGNKPGASEYMLKASQAEPDNADYAFYYASGLGITAPEKWEAASLEVARRFPSSERGAQALYWLGQKSAGDAKRIAFWEQARAAFPPGKFMWTGYSMESLFEAYLRTTPDKAIALARDMAAGLKDEEAKAWSERVDFAKAFQAARTLADIGSHAEALAVIEKLPVGRRTANPGLTQLLKAEVMAGAGKSQAAYDSIVQRFAGSPEDELKAALEKYGAPLGKNVAQIDADVWAARDAAAKPAPAFDLGLYTSDKSLSLASLKGKVVFVTFWFPGCGPCRGEFPHFENVVTRFKGNKELVYLGINGIRQQDAYVVPFMEGTKYSFTPLKGGEVDKAYGVRGYPSNFLIDRDGRIVFANFRADDPQAEVVLQRMIEALLARPSRT